MIEDVVGALGASEVRAVEGGTLAGAIGARSGPELARTIRAAEPVGLAEAVVGTHAELQRGRPALGGVPADAGRADLRARRAGVEQREAPLASSPARLPLLRPRGPR